MKNDNLLPAEATWIRRLLYKWAYWWGGIGDKNVVEIRKWPMKWIFSSWEKMSDISAKETAEKRGQLGMKLQNDTEGWKPSLIETEKERRTVMEKGQVV